MLAIFNHSVAQRAEGTGREDLQREAGRKGKGGRCREQQEVQVC